MQKWQIALFYSEFGHFKVDNALKKIILTIRATMCCTEIFFSWSTQRKKTSNQPRGTNVGSCILSFFCGTQIIEKQSLVWYWSNDFELMVVACSIFSLEKRSMTFLWIMEAQSSKLKVTTPMKPLVCDLSGQDLEIGTSYNFEII